MCSEVQIFILIEVLLLTILIIKRNTNKLKIYTGDHIDRLTFTADEKKER